MIFFIEEELKNFEYKKKKLFKIMIAITALFIVLITLSLILLSYIPHVLDLILDIIFTFSMISIDYFIAYDLIGIYREIKLNEEINRRYKEIEAVVLEIKGDYTIERKTYIEVVVHIDGERNNTRIFYSKDYDFNLELNKKYIFKIASYNRIKEYQDA